MEIESLVGLDSVNVIGYFIEGIDDDKLNKYVLHDVKRINELKNKISIYEKIRPLWTWDDHIETYLKMQWQRRRLGMKDVVWSVATKDNCLTVALVLE